MTYRCGSNKYPAEAAGLKTGIGPGAKEESYCRSDLRYAVASRMKTNSGAVSDGLPPTCPAGQGRQFFAYMICTHCFQIAKSLAFFIWSGNRSNRGMITRARSLWRFTCQLICGLSRPFSPRTWMVPTPTLAAIALSPVESSPRSLIPNRTAHWRMYEGSNLGFCSRFFQALQVKKPSPSTKPDRYQPNASSDIDLIEWTSLMAGFLENSVMGGVRKVTLPDPFILPFFPSQERTVA